MNARSPSGPLPPRRRRTAVALAAAALAAIGGERPTLAFQQEKVAVAKPEAGRQLALGKEPLTLTIDLDGAWAETLRSAARPGRPDASIRLQIEGLRPGPDTWAGGGRVFVNLPGEPEDLDPTLLSAESPHYVGSFKFFPTEGEVQSFTLTPAAALQRLARRDELGELRSLRVTLIGLPRREREGASDRTREVPFRSLSLKAKEPAGG